jgi:hypothetical protein
LAFQCSPADQEVIQKAAKEISALKQAGVLLFCPAPLSSGPIIRIVLVSENARMDLQNKLQEEKQRSETRQTRFSERLKPTQILHT